MARKARIQFNTISCRGGCGKQVTTTNRSIIHGLDSLHKQYGGYCDKCLPIPEDPKVNLIVTVILSTFAILCAVMFLYHLILAVVFVDKGVISGTLSYYELKSFIGYSDNSGFFALARDMSLYIAYFGISLFLFVFYTMLTFLLLDWFVIYLLPRNDSTFRVFTSLQYKRYQEMKNREKYY